ncbi:hypothetical protein D0T84_06290 [Dysgonomonas sp. 521]|nr:hypothetical protein [Dysgonomonas sp. 521]
MIKIKQNISTFYTVFAPANLVISCILLKREKKETNLIKPIFGRANIWKTIFVPEFYLSKS